MYNTITGTQTLNNNALTSICNVWLEKGVYFVSTNIRITLPNNCTLEQFISIDGTQDGRGTNINVLQAGFHSNNIGFFIEITKKSSNVVLQARQNSGSNISAIGWLNVTRLI